MEEIQAKIKAVQEKVAECELISKLTPDQEREKHFSRLAEHLRCVEATLRRSLQERV